MIFLGFFGVQSFLFGIEWFSILWIWYNLMLFFTDFLFLIHCTNFLYIYDNFDFISIIKAYEVELFNYTLYLYHFALKVSIKIFENYFFIFECNIIFRFFFLFLITYLWILSIMLKLLWRKSWAVSNSRRKFNKLVNLLITMSLKPANFLTSFSIFILGVALFCSWKSDIKHLIYVDM